MKEMQPIILNSDIDTPSFIQFWNELRKFHHFVLKMIMVGYWFLIRRYPERIANVTKSKMHKDENLLNHQHIS